MSILYAAHQKAFRIAAAVILLMFIGLGVLSLSIAKSVQEDILAVRQFSFSGNTQPHWQAGVVGTRPKSNSPWFLVVGDSISGGITPTSLISGENHSWVIPFRARLADEGARWDADVLACSGENTSSYYQGCPMAPTNPLLQGRPQHEVAMEDIRTHGATLKFIVVELGANDLFGIKNSPTYKREMDAVVGRLQRIIDELRKAAPDVPILVADVYNPFAADKQSYVPQINYLNAAIAAMALQEKATIIDFAQAFNPDDSPTRQELCQFVDCAHRDIHPTAAGALALADAGLQALGTADAALFGG